MEPKNSTELEFLAKLDVVGVEQVRTNFIKEIYGDHGEKRELVLEWLLRKEEARAQEASDKCDILEVEILSVKRSASIQVWKNRIIAIAAIIIAVIAAQEEIMWLISSVKPWIPK